jgi:hypothetical protein
MIMGGQDKEQGEDADGPSSYIFLKNLDKGLK